MSCEFWTYTRLTRLPWYFVCVVLGLTVLAFVLVTHARGFQCAWDILIGVTGPFGRGDRGLTVPLSLLGYVFVPIVVSVAVATAIASFVRGRLLSDTEAQQEMRRLVRPALERYAQEARKDEEKV
jgi:hypothetical protein